jgi:formylglycine-generating enzyme
VLRPVDPRGGGEQGSLDPAQPQFSISRKVIKGGSFLCADSYCLRYRPAARRPQMVDTGMSHIGFRCVTESDGSPTPDGK